jgi:hypothetical protein
MKYFQNTFLFLIALAVTTSCNSYRDKAFLACNQANFFANFDEYKTNRDKSVALFSDSKKDFIGCDQKYSNAFKDAEQRAFAASLDRTTRALAICRDDMAREVDYNKAWFEKVSSDEMVVGYDKYKKLYPTTRNFDVDALNKCANYYKNYSENQQRKEMISANLEKSLLKKYRYKLVWNEKGLSGLMQAIDAGEVNVAKAKKYLIKKDNLLFDPDLIVDEVLGNLVIYKNIYDMGIKIAVQKNKNELYAKDSSLNGSYFIVVDTKKFKINDKVSEILVFKKIF